MEWLHAPNPYSGLGGTTSEIPELVGPSDIPEASGTAVHLGVGVKGPVSIDLASESPHVLVNAPTGLGKSTVARSIAVQRLSLGDIVVVLDRKMHSHMWARQLSPVVHYADTTELIGSALVNLGRELHRRNQLVKAGKSAIGPRIVIVFEETNATLSQLKVLDKRQAQGTYGALNAFSDLMFMGRAVHMHVVAFAQLASWRSGLTADLLENFGTKVLVGYSERAWTWLASECGRYRVAPSEIGRGMVVHKGKARETQLTYLPEEEAASTVLGSVLAQRRARDLSGGRSNLPPQWRSAISR